MTLSTYLLYVAAMALLIVTPGPTMLMCMTNSMNHGTRRAMTSVAGATTAVLGVMVLSAMGLGAVLATSEAAFFPQFLNPAEPMLPQFTILALTFVAFEFTVLTLCALGVARVVPLLKSSGPVKWGNRICGGLFTLMGGLLLLTRRQS